MGKYCCNTKEDYSIITDSKKRKQLISVMIKARQNKGIM